METSYSLNSNCNGNIMNILNSNKIHDDKKRAEITAMGMSPGQVLCISRGCCSKCHVGIL